MAEVRSKARGTRFVGEMKWGGYWHTVKNGALGSKVVGHGRVVTFGSREAARAAAREVAQRYVATQTR